MGGGFKWRRHLYKDNTGGLTVIGHDARLHRLGVVGHLAHVLGLDEAYAAVDGETDDHGQVGHGRAHGDDDRLHHAEVLLGHAAVDLVARVVFCTWRGQGECY